MTGPLDFSQFKPGGQERPEGPITFTQFRQMTDVERTLRDFAASNNIGDLPSIRLPGDWERLQTLSDAYTGLRHQYFLREQAPSPVVGTEEFLRVKEGELSQYRDQMAQIRQSITTDFGHEVFRAVRDAAAMGLGEEWEPKEVSGLSLPLRFNALEKIPIVGPALAESPEAARILGHMFANPKTAALSLAHMAAIPITVPLAQLHELATQTDVLSPIISREKAIALFGDMTPEQALQARRAFYALGVASVIPGLTTTIFRTTIPPSLAASRSTFIRGLGEALSTEATGHIAESVIGAASVGATFGAFSGETKEERTANALAFALLALPFGSAHGLYRAMKGPKAREGVQSAADVEQVRSVRAFDDVAGTNVRQADIKFGTLTEGPLINGRVVPRLPDGAAPKVLYRLLSRSEYDAAVESGTLTSRAGRIHASGKPELQYTEPGPGNVLVEIAYDDASGWAAKPTLDEVVAITKQPIPMDKVRVVAEGSRDILEGVVSVTRPDIVERPTIDAALIQRAVTERPEAFEVARRDALEQRRLRVARGEEASTIRETIAQAAREVLDISEPEVRREFGTAPETTADRIVYIDNYRGGSEVGVTTAGPPTTVRAFHGTFREGLATKDVKKFGGIHVGSKQAAINRLEHTRGSQHQGRPGGENIIEVDVTLNRPLGSLDKPITEHDLFLILNLKDRLAEVKSRYDGIIYENSVEDPGGVSILAFNIRSVRSVEPTPELTARPRPTERPEGIRPETTADRIAAEREPPPNEIAIPRDDFTPEAQQIAERGKLPDATETALSSNLAEAAQSLNVAATLMEAHRRAIPDGVAIIPGLDSPKEALAFVKDLTNEAGYVAVFKRPDGLYDVAVGGNKSKLRGKVAQFQSTGWYEGQPVAVDGKFYEYAKPLDTPKYPNSAILQIPGTKEQMIVPEANMRRAPFDNIVSPPERFKLTDLKEALDPYEYEAFKQAWNEINGELTAIPDPEVMAGSNNMIVERSGPGTWRVLDAETKRPLVRGLRSKEEAQQFIKNSGQATGQEFVGRDAGNVPPDIPVNEIASASPPPPPPPSGMPEPIIIPKPFFMGRIAQAFHTFLAESASWITDSKSRFEVFDRVYGTNLLNEVYLPTQQAFLEALNKSRIWLERAKGIESKMKGLSAERREVLGDYIEAMSFDEMISENGLFVGRTVSEQAINIARRLARMDTNIPKIFEFQRTVRERLDMEARMQEVEVDALELADRQRVRREVASEMDMTRSELLAADTFDFIRMQSLDDLGLYEVTRMAEALMEKFPSRAEVEAQYKITGRERALVKEIEQMFGDVATELGIEDYRLLRGYLQHMRNYSVGAPSEAVSTAFLGQRGRRGSAATRMQNFAGDMVRAGEVSVYERDPILNLVLYIRKGFMDRYFKETWNEAIQNVNRTLSSKGLGKDSSEYASLQGYLNDLRGVPSPKVESHQRAFNRLLESVGIKASVDVQRDVVNRMTSLNSAAAMAFRIGLGLRDLKDYLSMQGAKVGMKRAFDSFFRYVGDKEMTELLEKGVITDQHHIEFGTPGERALASRRPLAKFAEVGLKASLQPMFHRWSQAAAYMDMWHTVPKFYDMWKKGEISKQTAFKRIKALTFEETVIKEFERLWDSGDVAAAADYLGKNASIELAGRYGLGNNPYGWRSNAGRLLGQFGNWSVYRRSFILKNLSRGTRLDRIGFLARWMTAETAMYGVGKFMGLDFRGWYTLPGLVFVGGPTFQYAQHLASLTSQSPQERARALTAFNRLIPGFNDPRTLLMPGSYFLGDIFRGVLTPDKNIRDAFQSGARAIAIPVSNERPMWHDF